MFLSTKTVHKHGFLCKVWSRFKKNIISLPALSSIFYIKVKLNFRENFYEKKIDAVNDLPIYRYWSGKRASF